MVCDDWLSLTVAGTWAAPRAGLTVPRQNGKNGALEIRELFGMVELGEKIIHTAHEVKTARKAFRRLLEFFDSSAYPELQALVREIRRTNGQEAILLNNGGQVEFIARSRGSGRGYSGDLLVVDEAQAATDDELAALLPILATSLNPQVLLTGTPPGPRESGQVFIRFRTAALDGADSRLGWIEWSAEPGDDFTDRRVWESTNPEANGLLLMDTIEGEFAVMDLDYFARERLGVWFDRTLTDQIIDPDLWSSLAIASQPMASPMLSVEIALDRSETTIGAAWTVKGKPHLEIVDERPGVGWVVPRLVELASRYAADGVAVDVSTEAASLVGDLESAGLVVVKIAPAARVAACGRFYDAALSSALTHNGDPVIAAAIANARWKDVGDGARVFSRRRSAGSISALYVVTLALAGHEEALCSLPNLY